MGEKVLLHGASNRNVLSGIGSLIGEVIEKV